MEVLEVLMTNGYKLKKLDIEFVCRYFVTHGDPNYHLLEMLKLYLATAGLTRESPRDVHWNILESCLNIATVNPTTTIFPSAPFRIMIETHHRSG
jgi:hypothetical protein